MNPTAGNPLATRADIAKAAAQLLEPLTRRMSPGRALIDAGDTTAHYAVRVAQMEAFSRPLWAIVPMLAGKCPEVEPLWALWREGLANGVDPAHPEYWGTIGDYDQRMVEMAVMGLGLCISPDRFWGDLDTAAQQNLYHWLNQINQYEMPRNNWVFFRVLVNMGFMACGQPHDAGRMAEDLALIEDHYEGNGWYFDLDTQRDYYTPWGFHYYGLVYARVMRERDPERCAWYMERAQCFAPQFAAWFDREGAALPYGRSQTYRFAQGSFFATLAYAEGAHEGMDYGEIKGLFLRNLRLWLSRPIFTGDGLLSIGYGYPNLHMAESYNAPGSPYWSMKDFIPLALPEDHPFWQAAEKPYTPPQAVCQPQARMLITRDAGNAQAQAFTAGNHAPGHDQSDAKYEKFVYSTAFAISVPRSARNLAQGAFDCMLALADDDYGWRVRYGCEDFEIRRDRVLATWQPMRGVTVRTEIIPAGDWHVHIHTIDTDRPLHAAEGGFALCREKAPEAAATQVDALWAMAQASWGTSGIVGWEGYDAAEMVIPSPNTNLLYTRTLLPTLRAELPAGRTRLCCAVLGAVTDAENKWANPPRKEIYI